MTQTPKGRPRAAEERSAAWSPSPQRCPGDGTTTRTYGGADSGRLAPGREWNDGRRNLSRGGHQRADVLRVEAQIRGLGLSELRELRQLREEHAKLKRLVADLSLDRHMLQEIVRKKL